MDLCYEKDPTKIPLECASIIPIARDDPTYGPFNVTLFKYIRSMASKNFSCDLSPATYVSIMKCMT